ncbi:response regulator transcription factor [Roseisolibacter sp. H3M3-2]|uniref:response regulator transcription factor n=1 Tax=Roseisolibacter sp. H3M3-2 TaxID=3031323 RepID=UPI0023DA556A|nr:response regulator transcription factor [Roseisolibacter sp. H3M3-2]MDF1505114.1 response regulator transcription factor [Roseisolibacter sp. H3M3-2]
MTRIVVVEDNPDLAFGLRNNLEIEGYDVEVAPDGPSGLDAVRAHDPDLVLLDLMLPGLDGFRVLKTLRDEGRQMPVLILTARGEEADKVRGLHLGADDYVTKPFGVLELLARVRALLRRATREPAAEGAAAAAAHVAAGEAARFGKVEAEPSARRVTRAGEEVPLAPLEYELLQALWRRGGAVATRLDLLREVWGYSAAVVSRTVDTHIAELRRKLEADPAHPRHILTVRKVGYRLQP